MCDNARIGLQILARFQGIITKSTMNNTYGDLTKGLIVLHIDDKSVKSSKIRDTFEIIDTS